MLTALAEDPQSGAQALAAAISVHDYRSLADNVADTRSATTVVDRC